MSLLTTNPNTSGNRIANTQTVGVAEDKVAISAKVRKKMRKVKDGTDGIDATDEREPYDRFTEGFSLLGDD